MIELYIDGGLVGIYSGEPAARRKAKEVGRDVSFSMLPLGTLIDTDMEGGRYVRSRKG